MGGRLGAGVMGAVLALALAALPACTVQVDLGSGGNDGAGSVGAQDGGAPSGALAGIDASSRVVALSRPSAEAWLLAGGDLAGVPSEALDLAGLPKGVQDVGSADDPDVEGVLALKPDVVLLVGGVEAHERAREVLEAAGVPTMEASIATFGDYERLMATFTDVTGRADLYEQNVTLVQAQVDEALAHATRRDGESYLVLRVSADGGEAEGSECHICGMLDVLGMAGVPEGVGGAKMSVADVAQADPDWVFVVYQGEAAEAQRAFEQGYQADPGWAELGAVKAGRVVVLPQTLFAYVPNARWAEAYAYLSQVLHGAWA